MFRAEDEEKGGITEKYSVMLPILNRYPLRMSQEVIGMGVEEEQIVTVSEEQLSKHGFVCIGDSYEMWKIAEYIFGDKDTTFAWHLLDIHNQYCELCKGKLIQIPAGIEAPTESEDISAVYRDQAQNTESDYSEMTEVSSESEQQRPEISTSHPCPVTNDVIVTDCTGDQPSKSVLVQVSIADSITIHPLSCISAGSEIINGQGSLPEEPSTCDSAATSSSETNVVENAHVKQEIEKDTAAESVDFSVTDTVTPVHAIKNDGTTDHEINIPKHTAIALPPGEPVTTDHEINIPKHTAIALPPGEPVYTTEGLARKSKRGKKNAKTGLKCEVCGLVCSNIGLLQTHIRIHTGERPFRCEHCTACFTRNSELTIHSRIHTGDRPYQCDFCGKMFVKGSALMSHRRTHSGARPYRCKLCSKTFSQSQHVKSHQVTHTGLKKYQCETCGQSFGGKSALTRHKHIHTKDVRYNCTQCSKSYSRRYELSLHMWRSHNIKTEDDNS